jgi:hypothetical protein
MEQVESSLVTRHSGMMLFFAYFLLFTFARITQVDSLIAKSFASWIVFLVSAIVATAYGWYSIQLREPTPIWRRALATASALALSFAIIALLASLTTAGHFWEWLIYMPWLRYMIVIKGLAVVGAFCGFGRSRVAFVVSLACLTLIW